MTRTRFSGVLAITLALAVGAEAKTVKAHVVALDQPIFFNRIGAKQPGGMIYALERDVVPVVPNGTTPTPCFVLENTPQACKAGQVMLRGSKRPRPLVLRVNIGDDLEIHFRNLLAPATRNGWANTVTRRAGVHVVGLQWSKSSADDGSYVGANPASLPAPGDPEIVYTLHAATEGAYFLTSMAGPLGGTGAGQASAGLFGAVHVEPAGARWFRSQVKRPDLAQAASGQTPEGLPLISDFDYEKTYPAGANWGWPDNVPIAPNTPILDMVNSDNEIVHSDLTAIIAGPNNWQFPGRPANSAEPNRNQPFREFTIIYHNDFLATQAYLLQTNTDTLNPGSDAFGINYGFGGIVAELNANRLGVGPMGGCTDCKFEEFFLSSWAVGDPAMLVDNPANGGNPANPTPPKGKKVPTPPVNPPASFNPGKNPFTQSLFPQATVASYLDDPSNVYHSYLSDHVTFRILSADSDLHHIHHQHAQQWLHTPNSQTSTYLDSQAIGPGSAFTLEMTYDGSGNRNKTIGDSIFHCHFYPHFAQGMWALWRVHDVFEQGTETDPKTGKPVLGARALPDAEIVVGTPIPALVPMPTIVMAPKPSPVFIQNGQVVYGTPADRDPDGSKVADNPGYPFFIPGLAGQRAPGPPLDTAQNPGFNPAISDPTNPQSRPLLDGGLPRHLTKTGTWTQWETAYNWSKDVETLQALELPEDGTHVEKVAMAFHQQKNHPSHTPEGMPGNFLTNGMGPKQGAPYADPCIANPLHNGPDPVRAYKAANIQLDVILNKKGWHFPQQRMLTLWGDVVPTLFGNDQMTVAQKAPEPFFFRANSGDCIEYWHTNLVPKYYELDNFQVRTPTDILGQHIHLVKFDVTSSDGAANGFNYEDGTMSPEEVQERVHAIDKVGGLLQADGTRKMLTAVRPFYFCDNPSAAYFAEYCVLDPAKPGSGKWVGARTTIQRWWADPLTNGSTPDQGKDRTMRTVFTHDHFGPSTHQQTGLYAALVIEPTNSTWFTPDPVDPNGEVQLGNRQLMAEGQTFRDGGPTSWQASIKTQPTDDSYREFLLALQDMQLAYLPTSKAKAGGTPGGLPGQTSGGLSPSAACKLPLTNPNNLCTYGWFSDPGDRTTGRPSTAINANQLPQIVSEGFNTGTYSVNYRNEPVPFRAWDPKNKQLAPGNQGSLSFLYTSTARADNCLNVQPVAPATLNMFLNNLVQDKGTVCGNDDHTSPFKYPAPLQPVNNAGIFGGDPFTPLMRAYQNDKVQVRIVAGSHLVTHDFSMPGLKWFFEPSDHNSGYRNNQTVGISEHFEMLFTLPPAKGTADYQYLADGAQFGIQNGLWGLLRAYDGKTDGKQPALPFLPNNPTGGFPITAQGGCPASAPVKTFTVQAITANQLTVAAGPPNKEMINVRENVYNKGGMLYVLQQENGVAVPEFQDILSGKRLPEPLVLRVNAGDCASVTVVNKFDTTTPPSVFLPQNGVPALQILGAAPYNIKLPASAEAGLSPQLLSFDVTTDLGGNLGKNPIQTTDATSGSQKTYNWYAGVLIDPETGQYSPQAVEFGATGLFSSDPIQQQFQGLEGALIVEPKGAMVEPDSNTRVSANIRPGPGATFQAFREFVVITNDNNNELITINTGTPVKPNLSPVPFQGTAAVNYGTEPWWLRMGLAAGQSGPQDINTFKARQFNNIDLSCALSNEMNGTLNPMLTFVPLQNVANPLAGDMGTPVYTAGAGSKVRFRVLNPGGVNDLVFELHGHSWQEEPYQNNSANIGNNPASDWQGSRMGHGARNHFDVVLDSAGGSNAVPGDYLYRSHTALGLRSGMLGVFRVSEPGKDAIAITAQKPNTIFFGFNSVNPDTGKFADSVDVFAPGTRSGNTCTGTKIATIPLNHGDPSSGQFGSSTNGAWWAKTMAATVCAVSNFGGGAPPGSGGIGTLDVATILQSCTSIIPQSTGPKPVTTMMDKHTDDMTQRFERTIPKNPTDLPKK